MQPLQPSAYGPPAAVPADAALASTLQHARARIGRVAASDGYTVRCRSCAMHSKGQQLAHLLTSSDQHLFEAGFKQHMEQLPSPQPALQGPAADSGAENLLDGLAIRVAALRQSERQRAAEELLYLWCVQRMADGGIQLLSSIGQLQPRRDSSDSPAGLATFAAVESLFEPAVSDAIFGLVGTTFGAQQPGADLAQLVSRVDRTQAAQLYAGNAEFGYFITAMGRAAGAHAHGDSTRLIEHAKALSQPDMRRMSTYRSVEAWHAAVRHAGAVFQLSSPALDDGSLPYPALRQTISSAQLAPSAHLLEHYSPPGAASTTAASAASKEARGWGKGDISDAEPLPEPDLVPMRLLLLQRLLLEASALGSLLYEAELAAETAGYHLTAREA